MQTPRILPRRSSPQSAAARRFIFRFAWLVAAVACHLATPAADPPSAPPQPQAAAPSADWRPLFDGRTPHGWRGFRQDHFPSKGWVIEDGVLKKIRGERGGDIVTEEEFEEFELEWEWRIPAGANSGVKYFVLEERGAAIGHEYQLIDDRVLTDRKHLTGSFYDVLPPRPDAPGSRIDAWNQSRVVVHGQHVEHWLNGTKILDYELGSPEVADAVAHSKFKSVARFGTRVRGHILLTDHEDEAWFRNLRIRDLAPPGTRQTPPTLPR